MKGSRFLANVANVTPLVTVVAAVGGLVISVVFGLKELQQKKKYREAKLKIMRGNAYNMFEGDAVMADVVEEFGDKFGDE